MHRFASLRDGPPESDSSLSLARPEEGTRTDEQDDAQALQRRIQGKVALEAIRGELTISQLGAKHGVHQTMVNAWKKQALENLSTVFEGKPEAGKACEEDIEKLHAKIGQLVVERDFSAKAFGR